MGRGAWGQGLGQWSKAACADALVTRVTCAPPPGPTGVPPRGGAGGSGGPPPPPPRTTQPADEVMSMRALPLGPQRPACQPERGRGRAAAIVAWRAVAACRLFAAFAPARHCLGGSKPHREPCAHSSPPQVIAALRRELELMAVERVLAVARARDGFLAAGPAKRRAWYTAGAVPVLRQGSTHASPVAQRLARSDMRTARASSRACVPGLNPRREGKGVQGGKGGQGARVKREGPKATCASKPPPEPSPPPSQSPWPSRRYAGARARAHRLAPGLARRGRRAGPRRAAAAAAFGPCGRPAALPGRLGAAAERRGAPGRFQ